MQISQKNERDFISLLEEQILGILRGRIQGLQLIAETNGLSMTGRVRSYYDKQLAQHVLLQAAPQPLVRNNIEVLR